MKPLRFKTLSLYAICCHLIATLAIEGISGLLSPIAISRTLITTVLFYLFSQIYQDAKRNSPH